MIGQLVAELAKGAFSEKFEDASVSPEAVKDVAIAAIKDAFDALSELPVEISEKPYAGLIFDVETHRMNVSRAALLRDIILKNFGLISGRADRGLETRIQKTIGDGFSAGDFFW